MKDTIAAISTALGVGAISIIRVSGSEAIEKVNIIFKGKDLTKVESHTINYGYIFTNNEIIDEVLVSVMKAPKTFTMEDIVEINCHGGISTTHKVLELILNQGVRLAEPGEFTKRAFLNGRIDLIKAESVMDLINSTSESSRKLAIEGISGKISNKIRKLRQEILEEIISVIEVNIDYPEYEDIEVMTKEKIEPNLIKKIEELNQIIKDSENGKIINYGIKTVIVGKPNVGKSSILNKLLDEEKAIVTDIAGTTRDIVEGKITIEGVQLDIIDTAGIRETDDVIEKIGVDKSLEYANKADLIIAVFNNNEELTSEDMKIIEKIENKKHIIVINKNDLETKLDGKIFNNQEIVYTNTIDHEGINNLKDKIKELFKLDELSNKDFTYLSNARQISLAKSAKETLEQVIVSIKKDIPIDILELDIKSAWETLGQIIGEAYEEELLDQLFKQFCLGK